MADRIEEQERRRMQNTLESDGADLWSVVRSESDHARNQVFFWFLLKDENNIGRATEAALLKLMAYAKTYPATDFNASLIQISGDKKIDWETFDDDEIRKGRIARQPGSASMIRSRPEYTVFDRDV